ncbi:unnamed protein product [Victoria cruziana]
MDRVLFQKLMNEGNESLLESLKFAVLPIAKVFTMCFLGFLMASKYVNILPANGRKLLNGLVFSLLLPCLIFSQLGRAVTVQKMLEWWFIPANVVLGTITGSLIGLLVALVVRPPYPYFKFTIIQIGIGNIGNVPLVLIAALCRDKANPFGDPLKCSEDGNAYISFGQWVGAIILYTYVFHMLAPPEDSCQSIEAGKHATKITEKNPAPEAVPLLLPLVSDAVAPKRATTKEKLVNLLSFMVEKLKIKQIMQPPIIASVSLSLPILENLIYLYNFLSQ